MTRRSALMQALKAAALGVGCVATALPLAALAQAMPLVPELPLLTPEQSRQMPALSSSASPSMTSVSRRDYDDFVRAIISDNDSTMVTLIFRGFNANTKDPQGRPAMVGALYMDALRVFDVLLKAPNVDLNATSRQGETPLMMAAIKGHVQIARDLISRGADVNRPGWTPLHYAVSTSLPGTRDIVKLLLEESAYIDAPSPNGTTPLMMAAQYSSSDVVDLLLQEGADVTLKNQQGMTAVDFARKADRRFVVNQLEPVLRKQRATQPSRGKW